MNTGEKTLERVAIIGSLLLLASGCATANKSGFLSGYERLHRGRYVENFWASAELTKELASQIYVSRVDGSRITDQAGITVTSACDRLRRAVVWNVAHHPGWNAVEQAETSKCKLELAITYLTPGSASARIVAGELGWGHAIVQVEGKLIDSGTAAELACFTDRRRDSATIGFEDLAGNAGPRVVGRMLDGIARDFVKELSE